MGKAHGPDRIDEQFEIDMIRPEKRMIGLIKASA